MTIQVVLRCAGRPSRKVRPGWFSKSLCLASLIRAAEHHGDVGFTFVCDGALPPAIVHLMSETGRVVDLGGRGNSASYRASTRIAAQVPGADTILCYVCEDDYLHVPLALVNLASAESLAPKNAYLTLYDHPDRYRRSDDLRLPDIAPFNAGHHEWRVVESTTMTFATVKRTLIQDRLLHSAVAVGSYPRDRFLWRSIQGLGLRRPLRILFPGRSLFAVRPGLAVHCEEEALSSGVDWALEAQDSRAWALERGIPLVEDW